ncbi:MAG: sugar isomerase [Bacteroidetes bacterium HGW-Bacteroidetes-2]|jgi:O-antigen/teichoic acid export membrane protein|nr:MAG: sugar isomerase [Bacteroidetes bacterium HGW-Bacteroidetes-2]
MGIVIKQSIQNTIITYIGFAIGALNTLFLYTNFLTDDYYGLVGFLLSAATIMTPLMAFGVHNTLIKFYTSFKSVPEKENFLVLMLYLPLLLIIPVGFIGYLGYDSIVGFLSKENSIIENYVWTIYLIAVTMAYFEIFYAWVKVKMQSVFGNFMREVFHRIVITALLFLVHFKILTVEQFVWSLVGVYFARAMIMKWYAIRVKFPKLTFTVPKNLVSILKYSFLIIIAGSITLVLLDIDKVMIGKYIAIENVAYYNVAIFIATVIAVPARAMNQITYPLTAKFINEKRWKELKVLYQKSSLTLFIISGLVFLLIILNIKELYQILPEEYSKGLFVVILISFSKLLDNLLGINNGILYNSDYYRLTILLGVFLAVLTVVLNVVFIPLLGIDGAAIATVISLLLYSISKIIVVQWKFKIHPFTATSFKVFLLITLLTFGFFYWDFSFHPIWNMVLKSSIITIIYFVAVIKARLSEDINDLFVKYFPF